MAFIIDLPLLFLDLKFVTTGGRVKLFELCNFFYRKHCVSLQHLCKNMTLTHLFGKITHTFIKKRFNIYILISISTKRTKLSYIRIYATLLLAKIAAIKSGSFSFFLSFERAPLALCRRLLYDKDLPLVKNSHTLYNLKHCQRHNGPEG